MEEDIIFEVHWTEPAQEDFDEIFDEIYQDAPLRAEKFGNRLLDAAASLRWSPYRCPRAPDAPHCRHLIIKKYRIIFEIDEANLMVWIRAVMFPYQQYIPHG